MERFDRAEKWERRPTGCKAEIRDDVENGKIFSFSCSFRRSSNREHPSGQREKKRELNENLSTE